MSHFLLKFFPPETRSRQRGALIKIYRKGNILEAVRAVKKIYWEVIDQVVDHLWGQQIQRCASSRRQKHCELF